MNAKKLGESLTEFGFKLATGGTDNHLLLVDLTPQGITGNKLEKICELANITINKNSIPSDKSALSPGGVRFGTPALTTRGLVEEDFVQVAKFINEAAKITIKVQEASESKLFKDFVLSISKFSDEIHSLKLAVKEFAKSFPMPGFVSQQ